VLCTDRYLILNPTLLDVTSYLQLYDLDSLTLIRETNTRLYSLYRHPDGKRLFLRYVSYYSGHSPRSGGIDVYNLETNTLYPYYSEDEVYLSEGRPLTPTDIQFTPDGENMYVLSAAGVLALGPILEIRTATKEVTGRIDNTDGFSRLIRLNPKDWAE
jgi:DNA-binding beta-propeller fold protein YncE